MKSKSAMPLYKSPMTDKNDIPLIYNMKNGPLVRKLDGQAWVPREVEDIRKMASDQLRKEKSDGVSVSLSTVNDEILKQIATDGFCITMLPWYPFSMISNLTLDDPKSHLSENTKLYASSDEGKVRYILENCFQPEHCIMSVWRLEELPHALESLKRSKTPLDDPLKEESEGIWATRLSIEEMDRPFQGTSNYVMTSQTWLAKARAIKDAFLSYRPYTFPKKSCPVEVNLVFRLQLVASVFDYNYRIVKVAPESQSYIRVPKNIEDKIKEHLKARQGMSSFNSLIRFLKETYKILDRQYVSNIIWLLRQVTRREEENSFEDGLNLIFFRGSDDTRDTTDIGKTAWRSLTSLEMANDIDLTLYEDRGSQETPVRDFFKTIGVGFLHGCKLRDTEQLEFMCPFRSSTKEELALHVRNDHGFGEREERIMQTLLHDSQSQKVLQFVKHSSEKDWLQREILDGEKDVGQRLAEFIEGLLTRRQWRSSLRLCIYNLEETLNESRKKCGTEGLTEQEEVLELAKNFMEIYDSLLLPSSQCQEILDSLLDDIWEKTRILKDFVQLSRDQIRVADEAKAYTNILTGEYQRLLSEANLDVTALTTKQYAERVVPSNMQESSQCLALALINSLHRHKFVAARNILDTYKKDFESSGLDPDLQSRLKMGESSQTRGKRIDLLPPLKEREEEMETEEENTAFSTCCSAKRKRDDEDDDEEENPKLYKKVRDYEEERCGNIPCGQRDLKEIQLSTSDLFNMDLRHVSVPDIRRFLEGRMLPGNEVVMVGMGSSQDMTSYELVNPKSIQASLSDYTDIIFQVLYTVKYGNTFGNAFKAMYLSRLKYVFHNVVNAMFLLSNKGEERIKAIISKALFHLNSCQTQVFKERLWSFFINLVDFLNSNFDGKLNEYFAVRLARHGDPSMTIKKVIPNEEYDTVENLVLPSMESIVKTLCDPNYRPQDKRRLVLEDTALFKTEQKRLIKKLTHQYLADLDQIKRGEEKNPLLIRPREKTLKLRKSFSSTTTDRGHHRHLAKKPMTELTESKISVDMTPNFIMSKPQSLEYDREIREWRQEECPICMDYFSVGPLEGLNCRYRRLEREFQLLNGMGDNWQEDNDNLAKFVTFCSEKIEDISVQKGTEKVVNNGMHIFHRGCIRRHIQISALDMSKKTIDCPFCKEIIYNEKEKNTILANINEIACRLQREMESDDISFMSTDDLINIKNNSINDKTGIIKYLTCNFLQDNQEKKDDEVIRDIAEKKNYIYFEHEHCHDHKDSHSHDKLEKLALYLKVLSSTPKDIVTKGSSYLHDVPTEEMKVSQEIVERGRQLLVC